MNLNLAEKISNKQLRHDLIKFKTGDKIKITVEISEGKKSRLQAFEGIVLKIQGKGIAKSVTVRKISNNISIERMFPLHSPLIKNIELLRVGKVRQSRIYYMRERFGKAANIKELRK